MELSWTVRGAYANWRMTMSAEPPDTDDCDGAPDYVDNWPIDSLARVYSHFTDTVNLLEVTRELEETRHRSVRTA